MRATFNDEKTTQVIIGLQAKFGLHIDSAGILGKGVGYMFLGLLSPPELLQKLLTAGIPDANARGIMAEINQKIFIPLREQIRNAAPPPAPGPAQPAAPPPAPRPVNIPVPKYYAPPPQSPKYPRAGSELPPGLRFAQGSPAQRPAPPRPVVATPMPTPPVAGTPKPVSSNTLLPDHEEPSPSPKATEGAAHLELRGAPGAPIESPLRQALRAVTPPQNLPGAVSPPPAPTQPSIPVRKSTDTDPYREPINEK